MKQINVENREEKNAFEEKCLQRGESKSTGRKQMCENLDLKEINQKIWALVARIKEAQSEHEGLEKDGDDLNEASGREMKSEAKA